MEKKLEEFKKESRLQMEEMAIEQDMQYDRLKAERDKIEKEKKTCEKKLRHLISKLETADATNEAKDAELDELRIISENIESKLRDKIDNDNEEIDNLKSLTDEYKQLLKSQKEKFSSELISLERLNKEKNLEIENLHVESDKLKRHIKESEWTVQNRSENRNQDKCRNAESCKLSFLDTTENDYDGSFYNQTVNMSYDNLNYTLSFVHCKTFINAHSNQDHTLSTLRQELQEINEKMDDASSTLRTIPEELQESDENMDYASSNSQIKIEQTDKSKQKSFHIGIFFIIGTIILCVAIIYRVYFSTSENRRNDIDDYFKSHSRPE